MTNPKPLNRGLGRSALVTVTALALMTLAAAAAPVASAEWEPYLPARVCTPGIDTENTNPDLTPNGPIRACIYPDMLD